MKNIKIVLSALILTLFSSCQDAIDITQPGELAPNVTFQNVDDLHKGLLGVYGQMSIMSDISFNSIFTDEVKLGFANGGQGLNDGSYGFILNANSADANAIWFSNYGLINSANRVIEAGKKLDLTGTEVDQRNDIEAQCRAMRAFAYLRLVAYFSTDLTSDSALGVMLVDHVPTLKEYIPRSTNGQIFKFINDDLDFAAANLVTNLDNSDNKFLSLDFITAVRARMAAYRGLYTDAAKYADMLINGDPANNVNAYTLTDTDSYVNIWSDQAQQDEVIFKIDHIKGDAKVGSIWASVDGTISGSPFFTMSSDLYELLKNDNDIRNASFVGGDSEPTYNSGGKGKVVIAKYKGSDAGALTCDEKVFRISEMHFIKAESFAAAGDLASVASELQKINDARFSAGVDPVVPIPTIAVPANVQAAWAEILKQRRIELCYEGHRYLDLKRLGVKAGVNINRDSKDCFVNGACFLSSSDYRFTMPIPNAELSANSAIKPQQNPGY